MPLYEQDAQGNLVPVKGELPPEVLQAIDRADEAAIVERLVSPFGAEHFLYSYPIKTREGERHIVGIGSDGAKEIANLMGNVEVLPDVRVEEKDEYFYGMVRAKDLLRNVILLGVGRQCKFVVDKGNQPIPSRPDEHAFVKAITKAQRNAILSIAPQSAINAAVKRFLEQKKIKTLPPQPYIDQAGARPAAATAATPAATPTQAAQPVAPPVADFSPVILKAKELGYEKDDMLAALGVTSMGAKEWVAKGITPESGVKTLIDHKEALKQTVAAAQQTAAQMLGGFTEKAPEETIAEPEAAVDPEQAIFGEAAEQGEIAAADAAAETDAKEVAEGETKEIPDIPF